MATRSGLYQRPGSDFWYLDYVTADGRRVRESSKTTDHAEAQRILDDKRGRVARGDVLLPRADRITFDEARQDLVDFYTANAKRDMQELLARLAHVTRFFAGKRLVAIKPDVVTKYVLQRKAAGAASGTVRNEVDILVRVLRVAHDNGKLERLPRVVRPEVSAPRAGFVNDDQFNAIRVHLPEALRVAVTVAYTFGWRKREFLDLKRHQLDLAAGTLRLEPGTTKNREGRFIVLTAELRELLAGQVERVRALEHQLGRVIPWLFPHFDGRFVGSRQLDPRRTWDAACRAAGVPGLLLHDLQRSAVRNMEQAGVPRSVATKLTGHKTESVYRRYAIVSPADLAGAAERLERRTAQSTAHSAHAPKKVSPISA
jgi:integrase